MRKAKRNQAAKRVSPFNQRLKEARADAKLTQKELASRVNSDQRTIDKLENRWAEGSVLTVQIAAACGVSPYWLATGDGPKLIQEIPPDAMALGAAWSKLAGFTRHTLAREVLRTALPFMHPKHPLYKAAENLYRESVKKSEIGKELAGQAA